MIQHRQCPVCFSSSIKKYLEVNDFSVSNELFHLWKCDNCTLVFTQDAPLENDIGRYYQFKDYISHTDTKEGIINRLYHTIRKHTLRSKRNLVASLLGKKKGIVLDVGSGTGAFLNEMQSHGWEVEGVEADASARNVAFDKYQLRTKEASQLFSLKQKFDAITMWHVLEHVHSLHQYIEAYRQLLKHDGVLLIAVPNYTCFDARHYKASWAAYDVPRHLYHFSPTAMKVLMQKHGFTVKAIKPMWFDSFYVSMLSERYKKGNFIAAILYGLVSNIKAFFKNERCSSLIYVIQFSEA